MHAAILILANLVGIFRADVNREPVISIHDLAKNKIIKMKINMLLTFDYELPLGGCKSFERGLFEPTDKLLSIADRLEVPIVLFADVCSAIQFKHWDSNYYDRFKAQVQSAIRNKHDVQLHIHPHWMDSNYENGILEPSSRFGLADFKDHAEFSIEQIIEKAHDEISGMCLEASSDYKCVAYRAGGYNVEPESKVILGTLYKLGVKYDSSVVRGLFQNYSFSKIDYRKSPPDSKWKVPLTGPLTSTTHKEPYLIEFPVSTMPNSVSYVLKRRIHKELNKKKIRSRKYNNSGKGYSAISKEASYLDKARMALNPIFLTFDRDHFELPDLEEIVEFNIKKFQSEEEIFITLISHPKSMGNFHFNLMERFIAIMKDKYQDKLVFTTYSEICRNLNL